MVLKSHKKVLVCAGGTGGHIFPGLAVAESLIEKGVIINWVGTQRGLEKKILEPFKIPLFFSNFKGVRGKGILTFFTFPFTFTLAFGQAFSQLIKLKPNFVVCCGGYITVPFGFASSLLRIPFCVVEQNAIMGTANRILQYFAESVYLNHKNTMHALNKAEAVGSPIRSEFLKTLPSKESKRKSSTTFNILILGGSQGSSYLNKNIPECLKVIPEIRKKDLSIIHQCGDGNYDEVLQLYQNTRFKVVVKPFLNKIIDDYKWADLVISRSGAGVINEILAVGVSSVLVPLPNSIDNHQRANANIIRDNNAAVVIEQGTSFKSKLVKFITEVQSKELADMASRARKMSTKDASEKISKNILRVVNEK
jgi:UDP-N-acetylglucosamine--N-acetylmuramyl-(pentapeptide) pyrophosphoryl-undecaprenol N-acetylglucosamine transferase